MRVVVDTNVLAAALIRPRGWTAGQLARAGFHFLVPAEVIQELAAHALEFCEKADCEPGEWRKRADDLLASLVVIPGGSTARFLDHPWAIAAARADPRDAFLGAAAAAAKAERIWTFDVKLVDALPELAVLGLEASTEARPD